jgi:hypothetical protein
MGRPQGDPPSAQHITEAAAEGLDGPHKDRTAQEPVTVYINRASLLRGLKSEIHHLSHHRASQRSQPALPVAAVKGHSSKFKPAGRSCYYTSAARTN